jgi:hypothetical protein
MSPAGRHEENTGHPRGADWGRVADGVLLAGLGVFFLVATTRGLPEGFWAEAVSFWPVLLVSAGIRIAFEKTSLGAGVVLGPLVVLGTLSWLAWGERPEVGPPGEWRALSAERPADIERARLSARVSGVRVDLEARSLAPDLLAQGRAASRGDRTRLHLSREDDRATLRLQGRRGGFMLLGRRSEIWELGLADRVPFQLDLDGAFIRARVDLRKGRASDAEINGAFNSATLRLPPPPERVTIRLEGAFNDLNVIVPEDTPVRYRGHNFPVIFGSRGPAVKALPEGEAGYEVVVEGAFNVVDISEGPEPEGGWPPLPVSVEAPEAAPTAGPPPAEDPNGASAPAEAERPPAGLPCR